MSNDAMLQLAFAAVATYAMHSTIILLTAWCIDASLCIRSYSLREWMWKSAAVIPLLSTAVQLAWIGGTPVYLVDQDEATVTPPAMPSDATDESRDLSGTLVASNDAATTENHSIRSRSASLQTTQVQPNYGEAEADSSSHEAIVGNSAVPETSMTDVLPDQADISTSFMTSRLTISSATALLVTVILLSGALLVLYRMFRLWRQLRLCEPPEEGSITGSLESLCSRRKVGNVPQVLVASSEFVPAAVGVFRPRIIVPIGLTEQLDARQLHVVLAHELAHVIRRDPLWFWLGQVLTNCLVWQPLNILAVRRWRLLAELQCDEWAAADGIQDRLALAKVLAEFGNRHSISSTAAVSVASPPLSQRIEQLLDVSIDADLWRSGWRRYVVASTAVCMAAALAGVAPRAVTDVTPIEQAGSSDGNVASVLPRVIEEDVIANDQNSAESNPTEESHDTDQTQQPDPTAEAELAMLKLELSAVTQDVEQVVEAMARRHQSGRSAVVVRGIKNRIQILRRRTAELDR